MIRGDCAAESHGQLIIMNNSNSLFLSDGMSLCVFVLMVNNYREFGFYM